MTANNNGWTNSYDRLLRYQTDLSVDIEQLLFRQSDHWMRAVNVLDFGAGNSYYASRLSHQHPAKRFTCVDKNRDLAALGKHEWESGRFSTISGTHTDLVFTESFDFIYSRHVLSYLTDEDRQAFIDWAFSNSTESAAFLTIDADDEAFICLPRLPHLEAGNERFKEELKARGGNRSLRDSIRLQFEKAGFNHLKTVPLVIHSEIAGRKYLMSMFMRAVAEIDHGNPLPLEIRQEIDDWACNATSYLQYGMFGSVFAKG
jgi:hypothetical protein